MREKAPDALFTTIILVVMVLILFVVFIGIVVVGGDIVIGIRSGPRFGIHIDGAVLFVFKCIRTSGKLICKAFLFPIVEEDNDRFGVAQS